MSASDTRCSNQYLLTKANTTYDVLKTSLREKTSRAPLNTLESMTFFKCDKDLIEILLNMLAATEDKKTTRILHYFLTEISQYKFTNVAETKLINTTFTKEVQHKDLARRIAALRNYVLLAPSDSFVDANLKDLVIGFLRKTGEDKKEGKEKEKKKFFARGTDASRERCMIQYGALVACRHRFARPQQALFVPVIDAIRSDDPAAARHATFLTLEFTKEAPNNVAPNIQRFLPHLKGKEAAYLLDPLARIYFANICTLIGLKADNSDNDFFQALVQTVLDTNTRVAFEGMASLALFSWAKLEKAMLLPSVPPTIPDIPPLWESNPNPTNLFTAIVKRLTASLSLTSPNSSSPLVHAACRTVKILAEAYSNHLSEQERLQASRRPGALPTSTSSKSLTASSSSSSLPSSSSSSSLTSSLSSSSLSSSLLSLDLNDKLNDHPLASTYQHVVALLDAPSLHVRFQALKTLVWLGLPNSDDSSKFRSIIVNHLGSGWMSKSIVEGVFLELLKRVKSVPRFAGLVLTLVADWCWLAAERVSFSVVYDIWKTLIGFGVQGRALVLTNIFSILDRDLVPQQRAVNILIRKNIFWFLGENGNVLVNDIPTQYHGNVSPDINNPGLKAIVSRLAHGALLGAWEVRAICTEALAKIAILSNSVTRIHIYGVATRLLQEGATNVATTARMLLVLLDSLLSARRAWLLTFKSNPASLDPTKLEDLYALHTHLVAQCEVVCVVPTDFFPLGPESSRFLNIYKEKNKL